MFNAMNSSRIMRDVYVENHENLGFVSAATTGIFSPDFECCIAKCQMTEMLDKKPSKKIWRTTHVEIALFGPHGRTEIYLY